MRDNLRLESRTTIPFGEDTQGPKVGISFNAENCRPGRTPVVDIAGQGAIILENGPWGTEYTGGAGVGDISYNLNFYIQSAGRGGTALDQNTSQPIMQLSNDPEIC